MDQRIIKFLLSWKTSEHCNPSEELEDSYQS